MNKKMFSLSLLATLSLTSMAQEKVPSHWIDLGDKAINKEYHDPTYGNKENSEDQFGVWVDSLMDFQEDNVIGMDESSGGNDKEKKSWGLSAYMGTYSVAASGLLGLTGVKATGAVEITWKKNRSLNKSDDQNDEDSIRHFDAHITSDMNVTDIMEQLKPFTDYSFKTGRVKNPQEFKKSLEENATTILTMAKSIDAAEVQEEWGPDMFRVDLSIGGQGKIYTNINLGGDLRARIFWRKKIRTINGPKSNEKSHSINEGIKELMEKMSEDLTEASEKHEGAFTLDTFGVGLGMGHNGKWGIAQTQASAGALIFFKRHPVSNKAVIAPVAADETLPLLITEGSADSDKFLSFLFPTPRSAFRKGLKKAFKVSHYFEEHAAKRPEKKKWQVNKIKVEWEISKSAIFGLATSRGFAFGEVIMARKPGM